MVTEQRERAFYRYALLVPAAGHAALSVVSAPMAAVAMAFFLNAGIPYALWALLMLLWMRKRPLRRIRLAVATAPLGFLLVFGVTFGSVLFVMGDPGSRLDSALETVRGLVPWVLGFGYFWVLVVWIGWQVGRRIAPPPAEAGGAADPGAAPTR